MRLLVLVGKQKIEINSNKYKEQKSSSFNKEEATNSFLQLLQQFTKFDTRELASEKNTGKKTKRFENSNNSNMAKTHWDGIMIYNGYEDQIKMHTSKYYDM